MEIRENIELLVGELNQVIKEHLGVQSGGNMLFVPYVWNMGNICNCQHPEKGVTLKVTFNGGSREVYDSIDFAIEQIAKKYNLTVFDYNEGHGIVINPLGYYG